MNLFDNIIQSQFNNFTGKQAQPQVPSFSAPQAPRTTNYVAPNIAQPVQKPSMTLFSDEQQMFQRMKADNLDDNTAYSMLKKRRMDILGGNDLGNDEKQILLKMQADNVPVKEAVSLIQKRRADQFNKKYKEGNLLQKGAYNTLAFAAGNLETLAKYSGNTLDFITGGTMGFGDDVKAMEQVTQSPEFDSTAFKAGTYAPDVALAVSPIGGGYLAGAKGMGQLALRSGVVGAGFGASTPIMNEGSDATMEDIATSAAVGGTIGAVSTPVLSKVFKYGKAGYYGGKEGVGKSISRDVNGVVDSVTAIPSQIASIPSKIKSTIIKSPEDRLVSKLGQENTQGVVQGKTVNIPVPKKGIVETVTMGLGREKDTKVLAGRALTPSYAGKTPKQIVNTTADVEKNTKKLYEGVRTGEYQGDISTLEDAANTVVTNLERIGAQIGDDVKGAVGKVKPSTETKSTIRSTLKNKIEQRSGAYYILKNFLTDTGKGLSVQDAMKAKRVYQTEIGKLIRSGDAGTDSYSALVKGVQELSDNIDGVVEKSIGSKEFLKRKAQYSHLKKLVTDIAKSAAVEGRRSPQTFVEQLGMVESMLDAVRNPLSTAGRIFAKEIGELNTRGGAWKELIKIYDTEAIKAVRKPIITPKKKVITPDKPTVKPNTIKNESTAKSKKLNTNASDTIPEGYFKNAFGEIQKNPSNKKGGFIKIPEIGKKVEPLIEEAKKYKSAEEFIKAQGEPVYHGTYAYKTSDIKKTKSIIESIYKKNGGEYTQTDINKIANDAKYILENRSKLKVKDEFLLKNLEDELSSKIKKPTIDFAGKSGKDVTDNSLGIYTTPDIDFAKRFTYDIDINPYSGKKTIVQPRQGYVIDMYYKGNTLDLTKGTSKHIDLLSEITGKDKGFISDKLKTKEGTKTIQKLLSSKREILKEKGFNAVKNYAWDDTVKKYKEELAILDDNSIKTKDELTDIYNQSKSIPVKNPLVEEAKVKPKKAKK